MGDFRIVNGYKVYKDGTVENSRGEEIKGKMTKDGYIEYRLQNGGSSMYIRGHRLVYLAFNGALPQILIINHKNENKTDNRLDNLETATVRENTRFSAINKYGFSGVVYKRNSSKKKGGWYAQLQGKTFGKTTSIQYRSDCIYDSAKWYNEMCKKSGDTKYFNEITEEHINRYGNGYCSPLKGA